MEKLLESDFLPILNYQELQVGDEIECQLNAKRVIRKIREISGVNYNMRFKVGNKGDKKIWVGKSKIFSVKKLTQNDDMSS